MTPLWVSLEGINGVGKTRLARVLVVRLAGRARLVSELTDGGGDRVTAAVIAAISADRTFLRTGHPLTETMALLALKVREHELVDALPDPPQIVIEDRGVDTVAVYQAAIATQLDGSGLEQAMRDTADAVYATAAAWRPLPDLTLLLVDDPAACEERFAAREGRPVARDERIIIDRADRLYRWRAGIEPARIRVVDRTGDLAAVLPAAEALILDATGARR